jgi:hypothetical protein
LAISVANWVWNFVFWKEIRTHMIFAFLVVTLFGLFWGMFVVCTSREIGGNLDPFRDVAKIVSSWGQRKKGDGCGDDDEIRVWSTICLFVCRFGLKWHWGVSIWYLGLWT